MLRELLTIKIIALLAGTAIISSFITYTIMHTSEEVSCSALLKQKQEDERVARKFFKHKDRKIGDGERF